MMKKHALKRTSTVSRSVRIFQISQFQQRHKTNESSLLGYIKKKTKGHSITNRVQPNSYEDADFLSNKKINNRHHTNRRTMYPKFVRQQFIAAVKFQCSIFRSTRGP